MDLIFLGLPNTSFEELSRQLEELMFEAEKTADPSSIALLIRAKNERLLVAAYKKGLDPDLCFRMLHDLANPAFQNASLSILIATDFYKHLLLDNNILLSKKVAKLVKDFLGTIDEAHKLFDELEDASSPHPDAAT
jgi:hypothetical protein